MSPVRQVIRFGAVAAACALLGGAARAQVFVRNTTDVPDQTSGPVRYTENVDFADVDLDGDFDAAFANGGDLGNLQDRLWINQGGLQGGTIGVFVDETASRYPTLSRDGRDVEFVDFDNDGDPDVYVSNTSTSSNQGNTWFTNNGGLQGGSLGYYTDETAARWINLGGTGSSIAPSQLVLGTFIDWSCDCDFGDLDNDGDMDLVHSTYGGDFDGSVPTRVFLNDGLGMFEEFNPSGFQLTGSAMLDGDPGLWCQGTQLADTTDTTGVTCDITTNTLDIDIGDIDGDFDLDILHGDRDSLPRFFYNLLEESGGTPGDLAFRDVSNYVFDGSAWATGDGHYEQELGDFDGDGDLDMYGLNWKGGGFGVWDDVVAKNLGDRFGPQTILPGSTTDDNEGDFGDYDNDGDLDLYVANFSGDDRLYRNDGSGTFTLLAGDASGSGLGAHGLANYTSLDAEWCDVDNDGDYDVFCAQDTTKPVVYWENMTGVPDTTAPTIPNVEDIGDQTALLGSAPDFPVRAHVYDNAAYYVTWYNPTELEIRVDGVLVDKVAARASGGQVFRAVIPSNLVGSVDYLWRSADQYGNTGTSATTSYTASTTLTMDTPYGSGTIGTTGSLHAVRAKSLFTPGKSLYLVVDTNATPTIYALYVSLGSFPPTPFPDIGIVNVNPFTVLKTLLGVTSFTNGTHVRKFKIDESIPTGLDLYWQVFGLDGTGGDTYSSSQGLHIVSQ
jgi:hypothetical protein